MKTAMQLAVEIYKNDGVSFTDWFIDNYEMLLEKEKEQIIKAYEPKQRSGFRSNGEFFSEWLSGEKYYNETYKQNK